MSSDYSPSSGRRSPRRGGRNSGRQSGGPRRNQAPAQPAPKPTLWQKITAFFGGKPSAPAPAPRAANRAPSSAPAAQSAPRRSAEPRSEGFRKPEIIEVTSPRLYVGNLSFDATEGDLSELFNGVGLVSNVEIVANKHTQRSKGFAFVQMQSIDEAKRAVNELHDKEYMGRKLVVSGAKAQDERRGERAPQAEE